MRPYLLLSLFALPLQAALAIDPGTAQGSLAVGGTAVQLKHAYGEWRSDG